MLLLLLDTILILLFAFSVGAVLRLPTRPAKLAGIFILSYADVVLIAEILGGLQLLKGSLFLVGHALLAGVGLMIWWRSGKPDWPKRFHLNSHKIRTSLKKHPELWLLSGGVTLIYLLNAYLVWVVPPNNWDSMTYHLSRVGYWLQQESFFPWDTPNLRQTTFPMNAEIGLLWTIIFWGTDQLAGYIQWGAALLSMAAIFGIARFLGYSRSQSLFAALIWATLPEILLESTTTQNDLLAGAFLVTAIYFFFLGFRLNHLGALVLSGVALGLAVGTKLTVVMALPGLALGIFLLFWYKRGVKSFQKLALWSGTCLVGFILFGAYSFILNLTAYEAILGPPEYVKTVSPQHTGVSRLTLAKVNGLRYLYQAADLTGLPGSVHNALHKAKADAGSAIFEALGVDPNLPHTTKNKISFDLTQKTAPSEDHTWFGPLGFLLLIPAIVYNGGKSLVKKEPYRLILITTAIVFFFIVAASMTWSPWRGRYFVLVATICSPLLAMFYQPGLKFIPLRWTIILIALLVMGNTAVLNQTKPLTGPNAIWKLDQTERRTLPRGDTRPLLRLVEETIPPEASVGLILGGDDWDYPLFGERFSRTLVPIHPPEKITKHNWLEKQNLDYLIVSYREIENHLDARSLSVLTKFHIVGEAYPWYLLEAGPASEPTKWDDMLRERLSDVPPQAPANIPSYEAKE